MKRIVDVAVSAGVLLVLSPLLGVVAFAIWMQDRKSPFYIAPRVGKHEREFRMVKFRSMVVGADKSGVDSTGADDRRITPIGKFVRRTKLDELPQLWNVLKGEMSLVGPRPNVAREVALYSSEEKHLLDVRPGITDYASIVFADEGDILAGREDPDVSYNQLIRPGKSRLGLFYVRNRTIADDFRLLALTFTSSLNRQKALDQVSAMLAKRGAPSDLVRLATRKDELVPAPPPGLSEIVTSR